MQRNEAIAIGALLTVSVAVALGLRSWSAGPRDVAAVDSAPVAPAPTPPAPAPVTSPAAPPGAAATAAPEGAEVHAEWQARLAREDELLVQQAVSAGCDAPRAEAMRRVLAEQRQARARAIDERRAGRLSREELAARALGNKRKADAALRTILQPVELEALDPDGARAAVVEADRKE